nr:MAG TPA: hypothetical protein [Caudoviricetes sp.]
MTHPLSEYFWLPLTSPSNEFLIFHICNKPHSDLEIPHIHSRLSVSNYHVRIHVYNDRKV